MGSSHWRFYISTSLYLNNTLLSFTIKNKEGLHTSTFKATKSKPIDIIIINSDTSHFLLLRYLRTSQVQ